MNLDRQKSAEQALIPWRKWPDGVDSDAARMAELLGRMTLPRELPRDAVQRVAARLDAAARARGRRQAMRTMWLRLAMALLIGLSLTSLAAGLIVRARRDRQAAGSSSGLRHGAQSSTPEPSSRIEPVPVPVAPPAAPSNSQSLGPRSAQSPEAHRARHPVAKAEAPDATSSQQLHDELEELHQALQQLRVEHDPNTALATLSRYHRRHPEGILASEAALDEVEGNLALGRDTQALKTLDEMQSHGFSGVPRASEVKVLYGELLAKNGRCDEAILQLNQVLSSHPSEVLRTRAVEQLAHCSGSAFQHER